MNDDNEHSSQPEGMDRRQFLRNLSTAAFGAGVLGSGVGGLQNVHAEDAPVPLFVNPDAPVWAMTGDELVELQQMEPAGRGGEEAALDPFGAVGGPQNILIILVDQMRVPKWLSSPQLERFQFEFTPAIEWLRRHAVVFPNFYVNATACTPSRACFLTGLYSHQHYVQFNRGDGAGAAPALHEGFPTFAKALQDLVPAYSGNCYWIGKWHLSSDTDSGIFNTKYGFKLHHIPGTANPAPDGRPNEGANGDPYSLSGTNYPSDAAIVEDFQSWFNTVRPGLTGPWCTVVSLNNPHDISFFRNFFTQYECQNFSPSFPPLEWGTLGGPCSPAPPNSTNYSVFLGSPTLGDPSPMFSPSQPPPSPWNYENIFSSGKPDVQISHFVDHAVALGGIYSSPGDDRRTQMLNLYYYLHYLVDQQVKRVMNTVRCGSPAVRNNTIVVFTSDHGEYGASHSLRGKGGGVYDEGIEVPLYVQFPMQLYTSPGPNSMSPSEDYYCELGVSPPFSENFSEYRYQMCSSVDFFRLICELGNRGVIGSPVWDDWDGNGDNRYAIHKTRESLLRFVTSPDAAETRVIGSPPVPYILTTTDDEKMPSGNAMLQPYAGVASPYGTEKSHVVAIRTKTFRDPAHSPSYEVTFSGGKYARYHRYEFCDYLPVMPESPGAYSPYFYDEEFYDYYLRFITPPTPVAGSGNRPERGNSIDSPVTLGSAAYLNFLRDSLGNYDASGLPEAATLLADELNGPLPSPLLSPQMEARADLIAWLDASPCV